MIIATVYKGLSNKPQAIELPAGKTIREALPNEDTGHAAIFVNSKPQDEDYVLREGDSAFIRLVPGDMSSVSTGWRVVVGILTGGLSEIINIGVQAYKARVEAEKTAAELEKLKNQTNADIDNRPFLRGASNTVATSNTQPYVCGRHLFTPYLLADTFYEISGTDGGTQHANIILECGFNRQVIHTVGCDDIDILALSDTEPQEGSYSTNAGSSFADGTAEIAQDGNLLTALPNLNYKHVSTQANEEVPKISDIESGDAEDYVFTLDAHALDVEVCITFSSGLYAYNSSGDKISTSVTITPQYSLDGGNTWTDFTFYDSYNGKYTNTFNRSTSSKELRYVATKAFSLADYRTLYNNGEKVIQCRVRSNGNTDSQICNTCYVLYYQSVCFDPNTSSSPAGILDDNGAAGLVKCLVLNDRERAKSTMLGLRLKATSSNESKLSKIFIISSGIARTWNGSSWSSAKSATRNPAAWALEILTSDSHALSKFSDDEIDLESFGDFYEHCEQNDYYFDYVISQKSKKETALGYITDNCGAVLYTDIYGRKAIAIDRVQENAVAVYNPQNIISIENTREFARRTDCVRVTYTNSEDDLYEEDTYAVMREENGAALELTENSVITDLTASGITTYEHVVKYARRQMAIEALRPKTTTIEVGNEGIFLTPYSKVLIQDDSLKIGTGHAVLAGVEWQGGVARYLVLKNPVTIEAGKSYGAIIQCFAEAGTRPLAVKVAGEAGQATELEILSDITVASGLYPEGGEVLSFGELDDDGEFAKITTPYVITGISRIEQGFSLELANYNEAIFDTGSIPDYASNITQKPASSSAEIPAGNVSLDDVYAAATAVAGSLAEGTTSVGLPDTPTGVAAVAEAEGLSLSCSLGSLGLKNDISQVTWEIARADGSITEHVSSTGESYYAFDRDADGYPEASELAQWRVRAKALNAYNGESEWSSSAAVAVSGYKGWLCPPLGSGACTAKQDGLYAEWSADSSLTYGDIRFNFSIKYGDEEVLQKEGILLSSYSYLFNRSFDKDGYPEKHSVIAQLEDLGLETKGRDLSLYEVSVEGYTLQRSDYKESLALAIVTDYYGTWVPAEISAVTATAGRDSIEVEISAYLSATNYGAPYSYIVQISKDGGATWTEHECASSSFIYWFNRVSDGYPEAEELQNWRARAKAVSSAGNQSLYWGGGTAGAAVSTGSYGTWAVSAPSLSAAASGRTITLTILQPALASGKTRYGTFCNKVQIQKPSESTDWLKPATTLDPYASEDNWNEGEGYVVCEGTYSQTMPLTGQTLVETEVDGETVWQSAPEATLYRFRVQAYNEAHEGEASEINATALGTGIQDIVQGSVTHDKISTPTLSAISANMGVISAGGFAGSELNYWALSSILGMAASGIPDMYEGAFRVGGEDEYILVEPQAENGAVTGYKIFFKAGVFEVTAEASSINGELAVQASEDALDRVRISPLGTFYEHRETAESDWQIIVQVTQSGVRASTLVSSVSLVMSNLGIAERRALGHDIGRAYLSEEARVWHFDTDFLDQNQQEGLEILGDALLAAADEYPNSGIDFTPAILAVSPYAEDVKVAYGQFAAAIGLAATNSLTVDFWIQYIWNENQTLFDIGNASDAARLVVQNEECYYNQYTEGRDAAPFNAEQLEAGDVCVWNEPAEASSAIEHYGSGSGRESYKLASLGIGFEANEWLHVGIVLSEDTLSVFLDTARVDFARFAQAAQDINVEINELAGTLILDELYIDTAACEGFDDFAANTVSRVPWGALDHSQKHFVLDADCLHTNIFDADIFKEKVRGIISGAD